MSSWHAISSPSEKKKTKQDKKHAFALWHMTFFVHVIFTSMSSHIRLQLSSHVPAHVSGQNHAHVICSTYGVKKKKIFPCHLTPNTISRSWLFTRSHSFSCPEIQLPGHVAPNAQANLGALQVESVAASHTSSAVVHLLSDISQSRHKKSGC